MGKRYEVIGRDNILLSGRAMGSVVTEEEIEGMEETLIGIGAIRELPAEKDDKKKASGGSKKSSS